MIYNADDLRNWPIHAEIASGKWVACRPLRYAPLLFRIATAWHVLTGKYDALEWTGQTETEPTK